MIKPPKLQAGDKIATVSLSWGGPGTMPHRYEAGKQQLQDELCRRTGSTGPEPRAASVTSVGEAWLFRIGKDAFDEVIADRPEIAGGVIRALCRRIRALA